MTRWAALGLGVWLALGVRGDATAQAPAASALDESIDQAEIQRRQAAVETAEGLDPAAKSAALDYYQQAGHQLEQAAVWTQRATEYATKAEEAPTLLETIRAELATPPEAPDLGLTAETTLAQIEHALTEAEAQLREAHQRADELQAEPQRRSERRAALAAELADVRARLAELDDALAAPPGDDPAPVAEARRIMLLAQREALHRQVAADEGELASYDARTNLLSAHTDRALRRVEQAQLLVNGAQDLAMLRRRLEAEAGTREAERLSVEAAGKAPAIQSLADDNQGLADLRAGPEGVAARLERVTSELSRTREREAQLRDQFRSTRRKVAAAGLTPAMGVLLRKQYEHLPEPAVLRRDARARQVKISQAQYGLIQVEEWRAQYGDIERQMQPLLLGLAAAAGSDSEEFETVARQLLTARRDLLDALLTDYTAYFDRLVELDVIMRALAETAAEYRGYIEERILWVRSAPPRDDAGRALRSGYDLRGTAEAVEWLFTPDAWREAAQFTLADAQRDWAQVAAFLALTLLLLLSRRRLHARLGEVASAVRRPSTDSFLLTAETLAITALLAAPAPLFVWFVGWRVATPVEQTALGVALSRAVETAAVFYFAVEFMRQVLRHDGLAEGHFRWPEAVLRLVRRHLRWLLPLGLAVVVCVLAMEQQGSEVRKHGLGRLAFVVGMCGLAVFSHRVLRARAAAMRAFLQRQSDGWLGRLRLLWYPLAIGLPLGLVVLAAMGYYYTALQLWLRLQSSLLLAIVLVLVNALLLRWLFIARRRLVFEKARQRREAAAAEAAAGGAVPTGVVAPTGAVTLALDEADLSIPTLNVQTRRLFGNLSAVTMIVGLFIIWADVLPALKMLDRVQIWPSVRIVSAADRAPASAAIAPLASTSAEGGEQEADPQPAGGGAMFLPGGAFRDASAAAGPGDRGVVTLADLGLALVIFLVTYIAARNLPGLLEIGFLQRLPLDAGARYAITTTARYAITIVGLTAAFGAIGIGWSSVQWLAAALTFGLAFGLQEIFANFVSGLIILAERPIRLGDTVTVGDVNGTVTRIRMRATTILDWDRKELIVPNKAFITDQLINWSLSDPILRRIVHVGVAYGSDVPKTIETLLRVAKENEIVLDEPASDAFFLGFGDSSLNFELRVFVPHPDYRFLVPHQLHVAIDAAFREAGIVIAFPQRDLHIKSVETLTPLLEQRPPQPEDIFPRPS